MQIFKCISEGFEVARAQEGAQARFDACSFDERRMFLSTWLQRRHNIIFIQIGLHQIFYIEIGGIIDQLNQIAHAIAVDIIAQPHLRFNFVTFCHRYITHIIAKAGDLRALRVGPCTSGPHPYAYLFLSFIILPVTRDYFAIESHTATNESEFAVAVRGLVQVHEIHVDR